MNYLETSLIKETNKLTEITKSLNMNYQHINLDYLDLMSDGDDDMKKVMIEMLLEEVPAEVSKMNDLHQAANWVQLREVSHKLKSTLAFIGNPVLTNTNQKVEDIAKSEQGLEELPTLLDRITSTYPNALEELKTVLTATV